MSETGTGHVDTLHRTARILSLLLHSVQLVIAAVILGLDSYGIRYIPYNALIYSLAVAICTLLLCPYLLASQLYPGKLCNIYISVGLHLWMIVFWAVNTGILADLAKVWSQPGCTYTPWDGYACSSYWKRDRKTLYKRDTSYGPYFGALAAGATLAGVEVLMWVCTTALLLCNAKRSRSAEIDSPPLPVVSGSIHEHTDKQQSAPNPWDETTASTVREGPQPLLPSPPVSPEVETGRESNYFNPESGGQPPGTTQVPPPWTSHPVRMGGGMIGGSSRMSGSSSQQAVEVKGQRYLREQIENNPGLFQMPATIPTGRGISGRRMSKEPAA